jgi:hypothetical protein
VFEEIIINTGVSDGIRSVKTYGNRINEHEEIGTTEINALNNTNAQQRNRGAA